MKILEMIATLGPGGAEALTVDLSVKFASMGAEVKVFLLAGVRGERGKFLHNRLNEAGVEVIGTDERKPASFSNLIRLIKIINFWRPDVVHCHLYNSQVPFAVARLLSLHRSVISVRTLHNTEIIANKSLTVSKYLCSVFNCSVACSTSVEDSYRQFFNLSNTDGVVTIENGCTLASKTTSCIERKEARKYFSISADKFLVINVGGFRGDTLVTCQKAQDILLKAFAVAFSNCDDALLAFAGDGPLRCEAEKLARDLSIESKVIFFGNLPEPWKILQAADLFAMPSRHEGLSLALLEAASTGLPIVASDIPEISRLSPGEAWHLCPVDDVNAFACAFQKVKSTKDFCFNQSRAAAEGFRDNYSLDRCAQKYWSLFNGDCSSS